MIGRKLEGLKNKSFKLILLGSALAFFISFFSFCFIEAECEGCFYNNTCYFSGEVLNISGNMNYCNIYLKNFTRQKALDIGCVNDFECLSMECSEGNCTSIEDLILQNEELLGNILQCSGTAPVGEGVIAGPSGTLTGYPTAWNYNASATTSTPCLWKCDSGYEKDGNTCDEISSGNLGGGGGIVIHTYTLSSDVLNRGYRVTLFAADEIKFSLNGVQYTLTYLGISASKAHLKFVGGGKFFTWLLASGSTQDYDLNSEGIKDVSVTIHNIVSGKAEITLKKYSAIDDNLQDNTPLEPVDGTDDSSDEGVLKETKFTRLFWVVLVIIIVLIVLIAYLIVYYFFKKEGNKKESNKAINNQKITKSGLDNI